MTDETLLPCPFCCGEAEFYGNWGCDCCYVHCTKCHARGETIYCDTESEEYEDGDSSKEEAQAIKAWNTRATGEKFAKCVAFIKLLADGGILEPTPDDAREFLEEIVE